MLPRHPRIWLMTDERQGAGLWPALVALPPGSGVIFRHYATAPQERRQIWSKVKRICRARRLMLLRAGLNRLAGENGTHGQPGPHVVTWPAHDRRQAVRGVQAGATLLLVSPVRSTRSHPDQTGIGVMRARAIVQGLCPGIALGGMDARRYRRIAVLGFGGWAAIDSLTPTARRNQKRNAVPT